MLVNSMATVHEIGNNFPTVKGASLEYICGVLSSAKAVIFNGNGQRLIETEEIRTTDAWYYCGICKIKSSIINSEKFS